MINMKSRIEFHPKTIRDRVSAAGRKVLMRQGAFIRGGIHRKVRYRKNADTRSAPGQAPFTHDGTLKKSILFSLDESMKSVVVGAAYSWIGTLANLHEFGGTVSRKTYQGNPKRTYKVGDIGPVSTGKYKRAKTSDHLVRTDPLTGERVAYVRIKSATQAAHATRLNRRLIIGNASYKMVKYPARPFVRPGFEETKPRLAAMWANAV